MTTTKPFVIPEPKDLEEALKVARVQWLLSQASLANLAAEKLARDLTWADADLEAQGVYHFTGIINDESVNYAIESLSRLAAYSKAPLTIRIMSPGGVVEEGLALYDFLIALRSGGVDITTVGIGTAASMGGVLLQAGTKRLVSANASMLIHEVATGAIGKTSEVQDELNYAKSLQDRVLAILAKRSTLPKREIAKRWQRKDWYLDAKEIVSLGFADGIGVR